MRHLDDLFVVFIPVRSRGYIALQTRAVVSGCVYRCLSSCVCLCVRVVANTGAGGGKIERAKSVCVCVRRFANFVSFVIG